MVKIKSFLIKYLIMLPNCLYHFNFIFLTICMTPHGTGQVQVSLLSTFVWLIRFSLGD